jgi:enoyl-CoA hydratase
VTSETIRILHGESIDWIEFHRPEAANAFNAEMLAAFSNALHKLCKDGAPVIGIRGAGKGFSAGMDLGEYKSDGAITDDVLRLSSYVDRWREILGHPKPVIIAVHGYCIGVAAQVASFADILIVAEDARISEPTVPIGGGFIAPTWVSEVGARKAKELAFLPGNWIDGTSAAAWGWANAAVPAENLIACAEAMAERMAQVPRGVLTMKKRSINRAMMASGFAASLDAIAESDAILHSDPDVQAIRKELADNGLKNTIARFTGPSSNELFAAFNQGAGRKERMN